MSAALVKAALRGLALPFDEQQAKLEECSAETRELLQGEMDAINWTLARVLIWEEQGVWDDVCKYLNESQVDAVEEAA